MSLHTRTISSASSTSSPEPSPGFPKKSSWNPFARRNSSSSDDSNSTQTRASLRLQKREAQAYRERRYHDTMTTMRVYSRVDSQTSSPQRKAKPTIRARASDMRTTPFPAALQVRTVPWKMLLSPDQVYRLVMGSAPKRTDDDWFIFAEGPDVSGRMKVHFHRSWTGIKIAELFVLVDLKGEGAGTVLGIKYNGTHQTKGMNEEEARDLIASTCYFVLDVDLETPILPPLNFD